MSDATFWALVDMFCRLRDGQEDMEMAAIMGEKVLTPIECKHPNSDHAPGLERASIWCPDCKRWVIKHPPTNEAEQG